MGNHKNKCDTRCTIAGRGGFVRRDKNGWCWDHFRLGGPPMNAEHEPIL